jgi:hypothetical protein
MKKISVIPLLVLILTSCSWFQKDDVKQALTPLNVSNKNIDGELIEDSEVNSE